MASKTDLPCLFEQILKSEENAEERQDQITQVNTAINTRDREIQAIRNAIEELQNKVIVVEKQKCIAEQCDKEISSLKLQSLLKQEKSIEDSIKILKNEIEIKKKKEFEEREEFLKEMRDFSNNFDPFTKKGDFRKTERIKKLESLEIKLKKSENELAEALNQENNITLLIKNQTSLEQEIIKLQRNIIDTDLQFESYKQKVIEARQKVERSFQSTSNDPEFVRLQKELNTYDCKLAEENIHCLRAELQRLKREDWQYQLNTKPHRNIR